MANWAGQTHEPTISASAKAGVYTFWSQYRLQGNTLVWDGTKWVPRPMVRWDGSAWVPA